MALVLQRFIGQSVFVDNKKIVVTGITSRSVTIDVDGRETTYSDNLRVKITPSCTMSFYEIRKKTDASYAWAVKLVFEAPKDVRILRGELVRTRV